MKLYLTILLGCLCLTVHAQSKEKKQPTKEELVLIRAVFQEINRTDQLFRKVVSVGTLDERIIADIDSVFDQHGMEAGLAYEHSLNLKLPEDVEDSLWHLQHILDFQNHQCLRGIFDRYGWIGKDLVEEKNHVQILLLMHPPKDWDIPTYLEEYSSLLLIEVEEGRMPPKSYAMFYDNMKAKILREPQLYGTNEQFDPKTRTVLPPIIESLKVSNKARRKIGLPLLKEGEYRLSSEQSSK